MVRCPPTRYVDGLLPAEVACADQACRRTRQNGFNRRAGSDRAADQRAVTLDHHQRGFDVVSCENVATRVEQSIEDAEQAGIDGGRDSKG